MVISRLLRDKDLDVCSLESYVQCWGWNCSDPGSRASALTLVNRPATAPLGTGAAVLDPWLPGSSDTVHPSSWRERALKPTIGPSVHQESHSSWAFSWGHCTWDLTCEGRAAAAPHHVKHEAAVIPKCVPYPFSCSFVVLWPHVWDEPLVQLQVSSSRQQIELFSEWGLVMHPKAGGHLRTEHLTDPGHSVQLELSSRHCPLLLALPSVGTRTFPL